MARSLWARLSPLLATIALLLLPLTALAQDDEHGVKGWEVFTTNTPGGGGQLQSTGLEGERTNFPLAVNAPTTAGTAVTNITIQYWHCAHCRDAEKKRRADEKKKAEDAKKKKTDGAKGPEKKPDVPTYDPRTHEIIDGKVVRKKDPVQGSDPFREKNPPPNVESGPKKGNGDNGPEPYRLPEPPPVYSFDPRTHEMVDGVVVKRKEPLKQDSHQYCEQPPKFECGDHYQWWLKNHQHRTEPRQSFFTPGSMPFDGRIVMTGTVVAGETATASVMDGRGNMITGAVIELPDGQKFTTDSNGLAKFKVPAGDALKLILAGGGASALSWAWNGHPAKTAAGSNWQLPSAIQEGSQMQIGGTNLPANGNVLIDGVPAQTVACSPTGMIVNVPSGIGNGQHTVALVNDGMTTLVGTTQSVSLKIAPPKTLVKGQTATYEIIVEGTDKPVTIELVNGSPNVVQLVGQASRAQVTTSGGKNNIAKVQVKALGPGAISLPCQIKTQYQ